jgi:hypothetical protein
MNKLYKEANDALGVATTAALGAPIALGIMLAITRKNLLDPKPVDKVYFQNKLLNAELTKDIANMNRMKELDLEREARQNGSRINNTTRALRL